MVIRRLIFSCQSAPERQLQFWLQGDKTRSRLYYSSFPVTFPTVVSITGALSERWQPKYLFIACLRGEPDRWRWLRGETSRINSEPKPRLASPRLARWACRCGAAAGLCYLSDVMKRCWLPPHAQLCEPASSHQWNLISSPFLIKDGLSLIRQETRLIKKKATEVQERGGAGSDGILHYTRY